MRLRDRIGLTEPHQRLANRSMRASLFGFVLLGIVDLRLGVIVNAGIALLVTRLPSILEREYDIPMDPGLTLWITAAVFLHALGTVGLPWMDQNVYASIWWWDNLTHVVSASLVAGAGYATARALDAHVEDLDFPSRFLFAFILLLTLALGVLWEIVEFGLAELADALGTEAVLTQYGVADTMQDLLFDAVGAVVVALWGVTRFTDVSEAIGRVLENRG
ncbi:putative membrane protein [Halanaeroarchaeum sp. HSR-CO]|uniref:hypothetical protein n=1 Tax=Halanaeroarchaeum sp. HSR-CO TaxID=2866382 RepID=UPI00217F0B2D|nr:hypothetical protein [Halanaeroarchaeum sp. HSR-CO]UWG48496.1 putative membrane protein [Halanaeroarchaeum sp. HSR-CO]